MRMIGEMDLSRGTKLPREEELARILGVSRTTVRQALNDLAADGIVLRRQGRGTFVNAASRGIRARFSPSTELTDAIRDSGYEPRCACFPCAWRVLTRRPRASLARAGRRRAHHRGHEALLRKRAHVRRLS